MTTLPKPLVVVVLAATTQFAGATFAQVPMAPTTLAMQAQPVAPAAPSLPAAAITPQPTKPADDWIVYDDMTFTPVVDDISRHLAAARKAFDARDRTTAVTELRAVAAQLKEQATRAGSHDQSLVRGDHALLKSDKALLAADAKYAQDSVKRMDASAQKVSLAAAGIESGTIKTRADLDKVIDKATRAGMDRRWVITDVATWYPVTEEPQRYFTAAAAAFARRDYQVSAAAVRRAASFVRLEAARATGSARRELDAAIGELDGLAHGLDKGTVREVHAMTGVFMKAEHAIALEHRSKAAESWSRKEYDKAGFELKAAAHGLESAASWAGDKARAGVTTTVAASRDLGQKLASGATWTRAEVANGFDTLGNDINALGQKIGHTSKATPFDVGA
ncbi:MAG: hypothetical protein ABI920_14655 [Casimicrobiaceae bacterium]